MDLNAYLHALGKLNKLNLRDSTQFSDANAIIENEILTSGNDASEITSPSWKYTVYMYRILVDVKRSLDRTAPTNAIDFTDLAVAVLTACKFGLEPYLHPAMKKNKCFAATTTGLVQTDVQSTEECYDRLSLGIGTFHQLLLIKEIRECKQLDDVLMVYLAAVFSNTKNDSQVIHCQLDQLYETFPQSHFQMLLILKSSVALPVPLQKMLHRELMKRLVCPNGFEVLCKTLIKTNDDLTSEQPVWKLSSAVFDIVGRKGHPQQFYVTIVDGIFNFFRKCIESDKLKQFIDTCVGSLSRIYSLKIDEVSKKIVSMLVGRLDVLCTPEEIFAGFIVLDDREFIEMISLNFAGFCSSVHVALPSEILVPYLRLLFQLFSQIEVADLRCKISTLIVQCLHNRERDELKHIVDSLLFEDGDSHMKSMHSRLVVQLSKMSREHQCVISKASDLHYFDVSECLIDILKSSGNNILAYNVFIHLFEQLNVVSPASKSDLIQNEEDLTQLMTQVFRKRVAVYYTLSELINHKPLHYQINENPTEMLNVCMNIIQNHQVNALNDAHSTMLVLSVIKEFLGKIQHSPQFDEFFGMLVKLKANCGVHIDVVYQIDSILTELNHSQPKPFRQCDKSPFVMAKELCDESEPHLKVYGLMQFIKLIRDDKDPETLNNKHAVLAISLICLKEDDSYAFLNCIKLLIVLCDVLENVVLEMLVAEYQSAENEIDQRLKIGEVIVKVVEGMGPMSYKYKTILINCFLRESTSSIDEIRLSSLSNLSSICRILSYQIHNFFQEMMVILQSVIQNDTYLPARRSAVMVLTHIIQGIDNLIDFQEILLPVYKTLRDVVANEKDRSIRVHAESGLQQLNSKIKDFLTAEQTAPKEIRIFNIKNDDDRGRKVDKACRFIDLNIS